MTSDLVSRGPHEYASVLSLVLGVSLVAALIPSRDGRRRPRRKARQAELDSHLKHQMPARGMPPADIERVTLAGRGRAAG